MYICPECGTEYTVVPDVCAVCGQEPEADVHIDLFAQAAEQERKAAEQQKEQQKQYQERRTVTPAAQIAKPVETTDAETAEPVSAAPPVRRSRTGLKIAAACGAAAVALGGASYFIPQFGKPAGFAKNRIGTFYMKEDALWFQNGLTGKTLCLDENPALSMLTDSVPGSDTNRGLLSALLTVSPDGRDFYYPKAVTTDSCTLMHCTAAHPEQAEEIAEIRLTEYLYNAELGYSTNSTYSATGFSANTYVNPAQENYEMNPLYLVDRDAVYYRDPGGQFCRRQNGQTEVIAPVVERFWKLPDQDGVYYITIPEYDAFREANEITVPEDAFRADSVCMNLDIPYRAGEDGSDLQLQMHSSDYAMYRAMSGADPKELIPKIMEDWSPMTDSNPQYLYYTVYLDDKKATELRRFRFDSGSSETVYTDDYDGRLVLLHEYQNGDMYLAHGKLSQEKTEWLPELMKSMRSILENSQSDAEQQFILIQDDSGRSARISLNNLTSADDADVFYVSENGNASTLLGKMWASTFLRCCPGQPYICFQSPINQGSSGDVCIFFRDQELEISLDNAFVSPDWFSFSDDGTRLFATVSSTSLTATSYPPIRTFAGELNGSAPVKMELVAEPKEEASLLSLALTDQPAEIIRLTKDGMFSGNEKIATDIYRLHFVYQPEYRQLCFIANEQKTAAAGENIIALNSHYCGTLMRRTDRKTDTIAENVTDFIPANREQFAVICGKPEEAGTFNLITPSGYYQADTDVTMLCGVKELAGSSGILSRIFS